MGHCKSLVCAVTVAAACGLPRGSSNVPHSLSDGEFWTLSVHLSEPPGAFTHSDNLVSNEGSFAHTARMLRPAGGIYVGVGPEQNFSFIAGLRPAMAFIVDIREENRTLHLIYKALFELSAERVEFVSRLFSRPPPRGLNRTASVQRLFDAFADVKPDGALRDEGVRLVRRHLVDRHAVPLEERALRWIDYVFDAFFAEGPGIQYGRLRPRDSPGPTYRDLMTAVDMRGVPRSYLASEDAFAYVKDLHARNLIVPIVGDFAGPTAIRRIGEYMRAHAATLTAFYGSNVEVYLTGSQVRAFCRSLATLPYDGRTWFIASKGLEPLRAKLRSCPP